MASGLLLGADNDDADKKELAKLEGVWSFALVEVDGTKQPDAPFETNKLIISKDGRYVIVQGPRITRGTLKLDPTKSPKHYDVTVTSGPAKGLTASGIYEIDGESYKICMPTRGKERPTDFVGKAGSGRLLHYFKREKQEIAKALTVVAQQEMAGTWQAVSYALDGKEASAEDMKKIKLVIDTAGKATALREGEVFIASTVKLNPAKSPASLNVTFTEGADKGKTALGIYKIEDDVLTICRAAPDKTGPTEFASKQGSGHTLMTYKREKAPVK